MESAFKRIKILREVKNFSQNYMASELGISQPAYAKIENGTTGISLRRLMRISQILQIDPIELVVGSEIVTQMHNNHTYDSVKNLYLENQIIYQKLLRRLEDEISRLREENAILLMRLDEKE